VDSLSGALATSAANLKRRRGAVVGVASLGLPLLLAIVLVPFRSNFASSAAALCFLALIAGVAILGNRRSGVLASVSSAIWFDFFLTQPYEKLAISHRPDLETTICIVIVGLLVNELASASRRHNARASKESDYLSYVHELSVLVCSASPIDQVLESACMSIQEVLHLRQCVFERSTSGHPFARILSNGAVAHVGLAWPTKDIGLPSPNTEILAQWQGHAVGRFVLTPTTGEPVSLERRIVAVTLATLGACAVASDAQMGTKERTNSDT
jgi:K+-sensing histidine kinase KdpD